jgi:serine protease Do
MQIGAAAITSAIFLLLTSPNSVLGQSGAAGEGQGIPVAPHRFTFAPIVERAAPAVVNIYAARIVRSRSPAHVLDGSAFWRLFRDTLLFGYGRQRFENSLGSGVIVDRNGTIVTNHHVVDAAEGILVALSDGRTFPAKIVLSDRRSDIAVLRIELRGGELPYLEFADSDLLAVGDVILAIGNPFGLGQTVTSGVISALARTSVGIADLRFFIQTDAAINPGNSGGAQIDLDGKLVGINTAIYSSAAGAQGVGFAVPSNMVKAIVESAARNQPLVWPWIGISTRSVPPPLAALAGLPSARGVLVVEIHPSSPALEAGLEVGDIVLAIDGFRVDEPQALRYRIATRGLASRAILTIVRQRSQMRLIVTLKSPPREPPADETWASGLSPFAGAKLAGLSPAMAEEIGLDSAISGVAILDVTAGSAADRLGLRPGDIVRALGERPVTRVADLLGDRTRVFTSRKLTIHRQGQELVIGR